MAGRSKSSLVCEFENLVEMVNSEREQVLEVARVNGTVADAEAWFCVPETSIPYVTYWGGQSEDRLMRLTKAALSDLVEAAERVLGRLLARTTMELEAMYQ